MIRKKLPLGPFSPETGLLFDKDDSDSILEDLIERYDNLGTYGNSGSF